MVFPASSFYSRKVKQKWVAPHNANDSDFEMEEDELDEMDDDVLDPDFVMDIHNDTNHNYDEIAPTSSGSVVVVRPENLPEVQIEAEDEEEPPTKRSKSSMAQQSENIWRNEDITHPPLPKFYPEPPEILLKPIEYFHKMFTMELLEEIVYQTNLYARQKDVTTSFTTDIEEMKDFIGIILFMGIVSMPSIEDYWSLLTRCPQVANTMSSKRFRLMRSFLHFNNNDNSTASQDRFFKIRPLFTSITRQFQKVKEAPTQSIDEVMVAYKGTRAGSLRQYIQNKPDKWGFKLFCRASIDGFIHDILMYQGEKTFQEHITQMTDEESSFQITAKVVLVLAKTMKTPSQSAIYADNWFTSITLVEQLRNLYGCRYVGTARPNRIGNPPLTTVKNMEKKSIPRGKCEFSSSNGILALRWKDNKVVTILSSDAGLEPKQTIMRYDKQQKKRVEVPCPAVIKEYNGKMGGIDKSDMLNHLYKSPMRARRWYMKLFGYVLDLCVSNAWLLYKRDCQALKQKNMPLKAFRLEISRDLRCQKSSYARETRHSFEQHDMLISKKGQKVQMPNESKRYNSKEWHMPILVTNRQTCKHCSKKNDIHRSKMMCTVCQVALCLSDTRNCFKEFHTPPAE